MIIPKFETFKDIAGRISSIIIFISQLYNTLVVIDSNGELNTQTKFAIQATPRAGIIIVSFGIVCIWVGSYIDLKEEGEGFMIIGFRFLIGGLISIVLAFIVKYFVFISAYIKLHIKSNTLQKKSKR